MADTGEGNKIPGEVFDAADKVVMSHRDRWWDGLDSEQRTAWVAMCSAAAFAVLGVPLLSLILDGGATPSTKNVAASIWLFVITLPVAGVLAAVAYILTSPPKITGGVQLILALGLIAAGGVVVMNGLIAAVGGSLADFYCYNDGTIHETACRAFNEQGLTSTPLGSPANNAAFLANVTVLLVDARGWVMVACGGIAGFSAGYLLRREEPA